MIREILLDEILEFDQRYRATFVNSIGGFKSVALIGTKSLSGETNLAIFNSLFHVGANPPLFGFIVRPDSVERHTLENILENNLFTVNHISESFYRKAHQTAARYSKDVSEFGAVGLTEKFETGFLPPFVKESKIQIAAELQQKIDIEMNGTIMIIALIKSVKLPENCIGADGFVDLNRAGIVTNSGLDAYYKTIKLGRLTYAKPDRPVETLPSFLVE